jgi:hypothetical protein
MPNVNAIGTQILNLQALNLSRSKAGNGGQKIRKPLPLILPFNPENSFDNFKSEDLPFLGVSRKPCDSFSDILSKNFFGNGPA